MNLKKYIKYKICHFFKKENGFSLIEMLLVVFIIAIVATVISLLYMSSIKSQKDLLNKAGSEANLRTTLYSVAKDLREATDITTAKSDYIKFNSGSDIIEFELTASNGTYTLNKKITAGGATNTKFIIEYITNNNIFSYYSTDTGPALAVPLSGTDLLAFKLVKLNFTVNKEPSVPAKAVSLLTTVSLRNRK
jgi:prepilin-type N-terminal cleavage/methylation domain-containing protein